METSNITIDICKGKWKATIVNLDDHQYIKDYRVEICRVRGEGLIDNQHWEDRQCWSTLLFNCWFLGGGQINNWHREDQQLKINTFVYCWFGERVGSTINMERINNQQSILLSIIYLGEGADQQSIWRGSSPCPFGGSTIDLERINDQHFCQLLILGGTSCITAAPWDRCVAAKFPWVAQAGP